MNPAPKCNLNPFAILVAAGRPRREPCRECEAVALELRETFASAWASCDQATKGAWIAMRDLLGGTEEDAERAENLAAKARFTDSLRINQALSKKYFREAFTDHKVK